VPLMGLWPPSLSQIRQPGGGLYRNRKEIDRSSASQGSQGLQLQRLALASSLRLHTFCFSPHPVTQYLLLVMPALPGNTVMGRRVTEDRPPAAWQKGQRYSQTVHSSAVPCNSRVAN